MVSISGVECRLLILLTIMSLEKVGEINAVEERLLMLTLKSLWEEGENKRVEKILLM